MIGPACAAAAAGAAVMALEILASRWLAPAFGFTLTTWALLISATLGAGALGAALGGRLDGRRVAALLALAGAWIVGLAFAAPALVDALLALPLLRGATVATTVLLVPPVVLLAAVLPCACGRVREAAPLATLVGRMVAASTAGSLAGTLGAALWLVPTVGLRAGALLTGGGLILTACALARQPVAALGVAVGLTGAWLLPSAAPAAVVVRQTPYGELTLEAGRDGGWRLAVNGVAQAAGSPLAVGPGALIARRHHALLLPHMHPLGQTALNVGLGGGQVPAALAAHGIAVLSIEINPGIVRLVRERFGFDGAVRTGDGRAVWRRLRTRFDFVVVDAFAGESLPVHLLTREAFAELSSRLRPGGILCLHLIGQPRHAVTAAVARTLAAVFSHRLATRSGLGDALQDLFLFASDRPLVVPPTPALRDAGWLGNETFRPRVTSATPVLTDDRNPLEALNRPLAAALRRASRRR